MSSSNCCLLNCIQASQEADPVVWYCHLFQKFPQFILIRTVKGFDILSKAELDVFLELACFFWRSSRCWEFDLWFLCIFWNMLNIWKFMVHILLKPGLENFEHFFVSMWDECNCLVVWAFVGIAFLEIGMKTNHFQLSHGCDFQISCHIEYIAFTASSSRIWNSSSGIQAVIEPPNSLMDTALTLRTNEINSHLL